MSPMPRRKDGTVLTMITQSFPMDQALGLDKNLKVDLRTLNWIGNMSNTNEFFFTAKIVADQDARRRAPARDRWSRRPASARS